MTETNHSTRGQARITSRHPQANLRLVGLALIALLGAGLVIWVSRTTWERVARLENEFNSLRAESFYLGVRMHSGIRRLNDTVLRYRLHGDPADYDVFRKDALELKAWFDGSRTNATTALEQKFCEQVGAAYEDYFNESVMLFLAAMEKSPNAQARDFSKSYEKVQQQSREMLNLCDSFIRAQRLTFDNFLGESKETLAAFQRMLQLSLGLLLTLAAVLVVLVYRGMIAPLRHQLTESQAIIVRQEKLASLGVLAAGVAHEIRNPLTAIKFRLFSLRKSLPASDAVEEDVTVIADEINRLERIVQDFLQFARPSEPALVVVPAARIVAEVHSLLKGQLAKAAIELVLAPGESLWVRADTEQIKQVLINLVQNAADSIGSSGVISLHVRKGAGAGRRSRGQTVLIEVTDSGKGIPPEVQQRLFDPFFSTKEGGTGLGLAIAARIVEKHRGLLHYQTELNRGTTFTIVLPRVSEHETQTPSH